MCGRGVRAGRTRSTLQAPSPRSGVGAGGNKEALSPNIVNPLFPCPAHALACGIGLIEHIFSRAFGPWEKILSLECDAGTCGGQDEEVGCPQIAGGLWVAP